ncbi:MAG: GTPase Era [Alphaproteobacteria bacterium]|jgi:GTP-binding protein Era|nr:GTPase Era [Alphaproteobacteria bacterium]
MDDTDDARCGFVAVLGAPNAGKSTLVNRLVGEKVAITSPKPGTTRSRLMGIALIGPAQVCLMDTPGLQEGGRTRLAKAMVAAAWEAAGSADAALHIVDAAGRDAAERAQTLKDKIVEGARGPVFLALNKVDRVRKAALLPLAASLAGGYAGVFMVSAKTGDGVADLGPALAAAVPAGPWLFAADEVTDAPARLAAAEAVREQILRRFHAEVPHDAMVEVEGWEAFRDGSLKVSALISVRRASQRAILLGKGGAALGAVGTAARAEIASVLGRPVHLKLFVKVAPDWPERAEALRAIGLA